MPATLIPTHPAATLLRLPVLRDNYVWLLRCTGTGAVAVIDPAEAAPVRAALAERGWGLDWILNTHHHPDHVGGNLELAAQLGARIAGPARDRARIPGLELGVDEGDTFQLGALTARVHFVPGHTRGHIAWHFPEVGLLFCGDTLFLLGCGRLFEGSPAQMWDSLRRLRALPDDTLVCCAHEYTLGNARFGRAVLPGDAALERRAAQVEEARARDLCTVPGLLGEEKRSNPFLRADEPAVAAALGLAGAPPEAVFAALRERKDRF